MPDSNTEATPPPSCVVIVDEPAETLCGEAFYEEILVRNQFALFAVVICKKHSREHYAFYKARNQHRRQARNRTKTREGTRGAEPASHSARQPGRQVMRNVSVQAL